MFIKIEDALQLIANPGDATVEIGYVNKRAIKLADIHSIYNIRVCHARTSVYLRQTADNIYDHIEDFVEKYKLQGIDWTKLALAGGAVARCVFSIVDDRSSTSDADLFVYGPLTNDDRNALIEKHLKYFMEQFPTTTVWNTNYTVQIGDFIDMVLVDHPDMQQIITNFDLYSSHFLYDGKHIWVDDYGLVCMALGGANFVNGEHDNIRHTYRIYKYMMRGFPICINCEDAVGVDLLTRYGNSFSQEYSAPMAITSDLKIENFTCSVDNRNKLVISTNTIIYNKYKKAPATLNSATNIADSDYKLTVRTGKGQLERYKDSIAKGFIVIHKVGNDNYFCQEDELPALNALRESLPAPSMKFNWRLDCFADKQSPLFRQYNKELIKLKLQAFMDMPKLVQTSEKRATVHDISSSGYIAKGRDDSDGGKALGFKMRMMDAGFGFADHKSIDELAPVIITKPLSKATKKIVVRDDEGADGDSDADDDASGADDDAKDADEASDADDGDEASDAEDN